ESFRFCVRLFDVVASRSVQRLLVCREEREEQAYARRNLEGAGEGVVLRLDLACVPGVDSEVETGPLGNEEVAAPDDLGLRSTPVEARLDAPGDLDRALHPLDPPRVLDPRQQPAALERES